MTQTPTPARPAARSTRGAGFTLIEMMITVAIIGILAAIALPAYFEQIARGRRTDMQTVLVDQANYMQRYYAAHNSFRDAAAPPVLSASQSPALGAANYTIRVDTGNPPTSFVLTATRAGPMTGDKCGNFTYDNLGQKNLEAGSFASGQTPASCWR